MYPRIQRGYILLRGTVEVQSCMLHPDGKQHAEAFPDAGSGGKNYFVMPLDKPAANVLA